MKWHDFEVAGETYHFCMNGAALFDLYDRFGDKDPILSHIEGQTRRAFDATCFMLAKLAEQGELVRRFQGHKPDKIPTEAWFRTNLAPLDVSAAKLTVQAVVRLGFKREEPDEDENDGDGVDLGLQELEKKNGKSMTRAAYLQLLTQILHLNVREGMLLDVGTVFDLAALEVRRRNPKKEV